MQDSIVIDVFHDEEEGNKGEKDSGAYMRPEMDEEYEVDLTDRELSFYTTPLVLNGDSSGKPAGFIRYLLELAKWENKEENDLKKKKFKDDIELIKKVNFINLSLDRKEARIHL